MSATIQKKVFLAGRAFVPVGESTVRHDIELLRLMNVAGLKDPSMHEGETPEAYGWRVLQALCEAEALLPMLACLIVPADAVRAPSRGLKGFIEVLVGANREGRSSGWTPRVQAETVEFLGGLDEPDDKSRVYGLVMELLFPFLKAGLGSFVASQRSSASEAATPASPNPSGPNAAATTGPGQT